MRATFSDGFFESGRVWPAELIMCRWITQLFELGKKEMTPDNTQATDLSKLRLGPFVAYVDLLGFSSLTLPPSEIPSALHQLLDLNHGIDRLCQLPRFANIRAYGFSDCAYAAFETFEQAVLFCMTLFQFCASRKARPRGAIGMGYAYDLRAHVEKRFRACNFYPSPICGSAFTIAATLEMKIKLPGFRLYTWGCNPTVGSGVMEITRDTEKRHPVVQEADATVREIIWPADYNARIVNELNAVFGNDGVAPYAEIHAQIERECEGSRHLPEEDVHRASAQGTIEVFDFWERVVRQKRLVPAP
jgi:hypothetical protein